MNREDEKHRESEKEGEKFEFFNDQGSEAENAKGLNVERL